MRPCAEGEALGSRTKRGGAKPLHPWGSCFAPFGGLVLLFRGKCRAPGCWLSGRRPAGVAGGGADAKRWGNPAGVPFTRCVDFFAVIGLSTARTGFKVLKRFKSFSAKKDSKIYLNQRLMGLSGS